MIQLEKILRTVRIKMIRALNRLFYEGSLEEWVWLKDNCALAEGEFNKLHVSGL